MAEEPQQQNPLPQGNNGTPPWRRRIRQGMDFFWLVIVAGLLTNLAVSGQTLRGVLQWSLQKICESAPS